MYKTNSYKNVIELLVDDEIDRQTGHYSSLEAQAINRVEVATYALNRLPPLYASSQEGVSIQYERGLQEFGDRIADIVIQALHVIGQRPESNHTPLPRMDEIGASQHLVTSIHSNWVNDVETTP